MTNNGLDHGAHRHRPPLALPNLQVKAAAMEAEVEAVNDGNGNRGGVGGGAVTVAVVAAENSRGRQQSTTSGSVVAKTAAVVATAAAAVATVAMAAADNSETGWQDISVAVRQ
jgi:hypothetical protein